MTERGPADYPEWFSDAAETLADYQSHDALTACLEGGQHQMAALCNRALEIQAERRSPDV